ncbi:PepSY domain-containing protein [Ideonella sp.]|uniref:PepSY domain-containing protein n=1 Tax=Ideonella sp. TaxID=1929293 RepID=UPI0035AEF798
MSVLRLLVLMAASWALAAPPARAGEGDHEHAREAVRAGEILPLPALLERLQRQHPGQVLELELEREGGRWVYEVKLLGGDGQVTRLHVDARTAEVLPPRPRGPGERR